MPELPEVETVVRDLRSRLSGCRIRGVSTSAHGLRFPWRPEWAECIAGRRIAAVRRRGKWILIDLDDGALLLAHLGMTGQMRVVSTAEPHETHTHLIFTLDDRRQLRFRDIRRFGSMRYCAGAGDVGALIGERLGPEPWDLRADVWYAGLRKSRRALKALLLDQRVVAGVGNIYADESLFAAGLSPKKKGSSVSREQAERLRKAIIRVLDRAIAARGSTIRNYVGGDGLEGSYQRRLLVYGRTGRPCSKCRRLIQCTRLAGRSTHYCPSCQPLSRSALASGGITALQRKALTPVPSPAKPGEG